MADPAYTQTNRHIAFSVDERADEEVLLLRHFAWTEELGRLPVGHLDLVSPDHDIKYEDYIGKKVTIRLDMENGACRYFHGHLTSLRQLTPEGRLAHYVATVHPWIWFHQRTTNCRIFQGPPDDGITVPEILEQILGERGLGPFENKLTETDRYRKWEYCVQYRESEFDFMNRLMEQEGISYFFIHGDNDHTLRLVDANSCYLDSGYEPFRYRATRPGRYEGPFVYEWDILSEFRSGVVSQRDFNFEDSSVLVDAAIGQQENWDGDPFELFDYPGEFVKKEEGDRQASVRWEEHQALQDVRAGSTDSRGLYAGGKITLKDHPRREECEKEYLIVSLTHTASVGDFGAGGEGSGGDEESYNCTFRAIPATRQFRPAQVTPKPVIRGPQTAIVVTTDKSEEILCDEYGRVKVQFHWDRYGKADDNSSCWIRVAQAWAGARWGSMFIPRRGQEVIVEFEEGDPDRPIITGRVHNVENPAPYTLPEFKSVSTIKSLSTPGSEGFNEFRIEDKAGEEQIFLHAQKNLDIRVLNDTFETILNNRHLKVTNDRFEHIEHDAHATVDNHRITSIGVDDHLEVGGKQAIDIAQSMSLTVGSDVIEVFQANHSEQTTGDIYIKGSGVVIEATSGLTIKCGGSAVVLSSSGVTIKGGNITLDGSMVKIASGPGDPAGSGSAGSAVAPDTPTAAEEADNADPGEMADVKRAQIEAGTGKYGAPAVVPHKPVDDDDEERTWIEIELVDEDDQPVPGEKYRVTLPDGSTVAEGTLDQNGYARVDGIEEPGNCKVTFPNLDKEAWEKA